MTEWATREDIVRIDQRLDRGDSRFDKLEEQIKTNTELTKKSCEDTGEMLEFLRAMKGAFKVLNWIGKLAKPLAAIVALGAALVGLWTAVKGGVMPPR
ncbi:MAG: hypothetical protein WBC18_12635 [Ottowia sp.]|uniref:hypothetical protein n=1 Tax=Ottowia sp. TaxID=1898956 RepID=UPI003C7641C5